MKRKILTAACILSAAAMLSMPVCAADISIVMDGAKVESDTAPQITPEGRTIVPLRVISENLGAEVSWDGETKTVTAEKSGVSLSLVIGENSLDLNGGKLELDSPAQIINGRTMVPLRVISESFGCKVDWDGETKTVFVTTAEEKPAEQTASLPAFSTEGKDEYTLAAEKKVLEFTSNYDPADVSQPVVSIVSVDDKDPDDIKVYGGFWVLNYDLNGDILECVSGGSYPGCIHMKKTEKGVEATDFEVMEDGENGKESLIKICGGDEELALKVMNASELDEETRKQDIQAYVKANKLDIKGYKDYGWDAVYFDENNSSNENTSKESSSNESSSNESSSNKKTADVLGSEIPEEFEFSSGAGGWHTTLKLAKDGSFTGCYSDSEMGSTGDGYPHGTMYVCEFSGNFTDIKKNEDGTYSMKLGKLESKTEEGKEWIEEEIKYIASTPYGIDGGKNFVIYPPETAIDSLSDEFISWWPGRYDNDGDKKTIGCYGIYNKETEYGFFAY
ncbi:MAG: copper amine oxidase N-terminal domain-containing protein [Firmicutes bacterium]|nr:copper amine oxidase N-terminal domain-containing protein [Bacillota bacterium]